MKPSLRTKSVGTKVSEPEFAALKATARAAEMTLSEWVWAVLLSAPGVELPEDGAALAGRVAVTEVLALRTILINLVFSLGKGEPMTHEQMQALIARADGGKAKRALERLEAARLEAARLAVAVPEGKPESKGETDQGAAATEAETEA